MRADFLDYCHRRLVEVQDELKREQFRASAELKREQMANYTRWIAQMEKQNECSH